MNNIPEADWKYMRTLQPALLERLCERINHKTSAILNDSTRTAYERYLAVFKKTPKDDRVVADCFDDWRRSTIFTRILTIYWQGLFTENELQGFTQQTRERIDACRPITNMPADTPEA